MEAMKKSNHMLAAKGHPNRLGIWAGSAAGAGRRPLPVYLHRLSGLALLVYFLMHILVTSSRALGRGAWEQAMARVTGPFFTLGEFLVFAASPSTR